jgi:hypothetical protein
VNFAADKLGRLHIDAPDFAEHPFVFSIPEFQGEIEGKAFGVRQVLKWSIPGEQADGEFAIDGDPNLIGIQLFGQLKQNVQQEAHIMLQMANTQVGPIEDGHSTLHLDTSKNPDFADPTGERTFFFTDMSWKTTQELMAASNRSPAPLRVGLNYGGSTLMWRMVVRASVQGDRFLALGSNRGYVLAGDHPKWPNGLLNGSRWGTLQPGERVDCRVAVYMIQGNLEELQERYLRDLKK